MTEIWEPKGDAMIDREKPLNIKIGVAERSDPVYALNKAGDFSKKSVREPEWPQDAHTKQPLQEINENRSEGAKRFEDVIARVIQLGEIPRGFQYNTTRAGNDDVDSGMGVVVLGKSNPQEEYQKRLESISQLINESKNQSQSSFPWPPSRAKLRDKNNPGHDTDVADRRKLEASFLSIPHASSPDMKDAVKISTEHNRELKTVED